MLSGAGEVLPGVIDDMLRAERAHEVQFFGVIHAGHFGAAEFGELDSEGPRAPAGAVDQHLAPRPGMAHPLQGDHPGLGYGRSLLKGQPGRFAHEPAFRQAHIFGKPAGVVRRVSKDFVSLLEFFHV